MDWIRRNWPDLIIGLALLAVIAGIIATLLSGGSFFPFGNAGPNAGTQPTVTSPQAGQAPPTSQSTSQSTPQSTANTPATTPAVTEAPPPGPPVLAEDPEITDVNQSVTSGTVTVVSPEATEQTPVTGDSGESGTTESVTPLAPGTPSTSADTLIEAPVTDSPASAQASESGESSALFPESPYRISVGSYRDASNAERRAESFSSAGYPVFIGRQDDLSIVLIGPYNSRADAEAAVATIQRDGLEAAPLIFELADDPSETATIVETAASGANATAATAANTAEAVTDAATTTQAQVASVSGLQGSYLQAGAYDSSEGARPQRERLEGFGFAVAEVREGSFIKLLVGPFNESDLSSAQARLNAQGVEHFVRTF